MPNPTLDQFREAARKASVSPGACWTDVAVVIAIADALHALTSAPATAGGVERPKMLDYDLSGGAFEYTEQTGNEYRRYAVDQERQRIALEAALAEAKAMTEKAANELLVQRNGYGRELVAALARAESAEKRATPKDVDELPAALCDRWIAMAKARGDAEYEAKHLKSALEAAKREGERMKESLSAEKLNSEAASMRFKVLNGCVEYWKREAEVARSETSSARPAQEPTMPKCPKCGSSGDVILSEFPEKGTHYCTGSTGRGCDDWFTPTRSEPRTPVAVAVNKTRKYVAEESQSHRKTPWIESLEELADGISDLQSQIDELGRSK